MIIDFYGIPGCGKSTVSHLLADLYRKNGKSVSEPTYELDHDNNVYARKIKKMSITMIWSLLHLKKLYSIYRILSNNNLPFGELLNEMMGIIVKAHYVENNKNHDYVIYDEGVTQAVVSLRNVDTKLIDKELQLFETVIYEDESVYRVYIKESLDTAFYRMNHRSTNDSRVEKEKSLKKKVEMMKSYQERCDSVSFGNCIQILGNNQSAEIIARTVESKLKSGENQ